MKVLVFCFISFCAGAQVKGLEDVDTMFAYDNYMCGCLGAVYVDFGDGFGDTYFRTMVFDADYSNVGIKQLEKVYNKFTEIMKLNELDIKKPYEADASTPYPNISDIKKMYNMGRVPEESFKYLINGYIISFSYSKTQISLDIFEKAL
jgi:hypothetical protein